MSGKCEYVNMLQRESYQIQNSCSKPHQLSGLHSEVLLFNRITFDAIIIKQYYLFLFNVK